MLRLEELRVHGLEPVSFEVASGECLALQGPSGSGKTVLLRAIADLDPAEGRVFLDGAERGSMPGPAWRARVRYAAAEPGWWEETPRSHFRNPDAAGDPLGGLGLDAGMLDRPLAQLSTGERQRLALARALEGTPEALLLDEPTGALDAKATKRAETLLEKELAAGRVVILVSHDPEQVSRLAVRRATIKDGRVRMGRA